MESVFFRDSQLRDRAEIGLLYESVFGNTAGLVDNVEGAYRLAICEGAIVAVTGILPPGLSYYNGYEVAYTAVEPSFRKRGLVTKMLRDLVEDLPDDELPIYASCWVPEEIPNLHHAMDALGFRIAQPNRALYVSPLYRECNRCPYLKEKCACHEDLYVLERGKER